LEQYKKRRLPTRTGSSGKAGALSASGKPSNGIIYEAAPKSQEKPPIQVAYETALKKKGELTTVEGAEVVGDSVSRNARRTWDNTDKNRLIRDLVKAGFEQDVVRK